MSDPCRQCGRGREACEWCHDLAEIDHEAICDCGLWDLGAHLLPCLDRADRRWVVVINHGSEGERR